MGRGGGQGGGSGAGSGGGMGGKKKRSWDDDAGFLTRLFDYVLPDWEEWGVDKRNRKSRTTLRKLNENAWSSGLIHVRDNTYMIYCCCACGTCVQHGHNQDLVDQTGCCCPCMAACIPCVHCCEMARARRNMRVRMGIKGRWYVDCCLALFCPWLTVCQETRELEMRTGQVWHPLWGFRVKTPLHTSIFWRGKDPLVPEILFGENRLTGTLPFHTEYPAWDTSWNSTRHDSLDAGGQIQTHKDPPSGPGAPQRAGSPAGNTLPPRAGPPTRPGSPPQQLNYLT